MNEFSCYSTPQTSNETHRRQWIRLSCVRLQCTEIKTRAQPTKGVRVRRSYLEIRNRLVVTEERWNLFDKSWWRMTCPTLQKKKLLLLFLALWAGRMAMKKKNTFDFNGNKIDDVQDLILMVQVALNSNLSNHANGKSYSTLNCSDCCITSSKWKISNSLELDC